MYNVQPLSSYKLESLRTFLIQESNYYGLSMLHRIEESLEPYMDPMQQDNMSIAIIFLIVNKKDIFFNMKDERIKQVFGGCPFNTLQTVYKVIFKFLRIQHIYNYFFS